MAFDAIQALETAGISTAPATDAQRQVLATLTPAEVEVVKKVNRAMADAGDEVEGHAIMGIGIGIF